MTERYEDNHADDAQREVRAFGTRATQSTRATDDLAESIRQAQDSAGDEDDGTE
jgi:hypothetical protein